jgi:hypothetical protein
MVDIDLRVMRIARAVARAQMAGGARAAVLTGSHVSGRAHAHSDIDLVVVAGADAWSGSLHRDGFLVTVATRTPARVRAGFRDPRRVGTYVPGWREAVILADPSGVAARLQAEAWRWSWDDVADACDAWVADEMIGWAEEVHKLVGAMAVGDELLMATQRSLLALQLAGVMAVRRRILFGTENVMWDLVAEALGARWRRAQRAALAMRGESLEVSCRAALRLYALAAEEAWDLLDRRQRQVVDHACAIAGEWV